MRTVRETSKRRVPVNINCGLSSKLVAQPAMGSFTVKFNGMSVSQYVLFFGDRSVISGAVSK